MATPPTMNAVMLRLIEVQAELLRYQSIVVHVSRMVEATLSTDPEERDRAHDALYDMAQRLKEREFRDDKPPSE